MNVAYKLFSCRCASVGPRVRTVSILCRRTTDTLMHTTLPQVELLNRSLTRSAYGAASPAPTRVPALPLVGFAMVLAAFLDRLAFAITKPFL